jgi:hypothetical protein
MQKVDPTLNDAIPLTFHLSQNYPNPFRRKTRITYCLAYRTRVRLTVLNSAGDEVESLVDEEKNPGTYELEFAAREGPSREERDLAGGKIRYRMEAGDYSSEKEMELLE